MIHFTRNKLSSESSQTSEGIRLHRYASAQLAVPRFVIEQIKWLVSFGAGNRTVTYTLPPIMIFDAAPLAENMAIVFPEKPGWVVVRRCLSSLKLIALSCFVVPPLVRPFAVCVQSAALLQPPPEHGSSALSKASVQQPLASRRQRVDPKLTRRHRLDARRKERRRIGTQKLLMKVLSRAGMLGEREEEEMRLQGKGKDN